MARGESTRREWPADVTEPADVVAKAVIRAKRDAIAAHPTLGDVRKIYALAVLDELLGDVTPDAG